MIDVMPVSPYLGIFVIPFSEENSQSIETSTGERKP